VVVGKWMVLKMRWRVVRAGGLERIIHRFQGGLEEVTVNVVGS
jgi:hypothetical protein